MGADGPASEKRAAIPPPPLPVRRRRLRASAGPPSEGVTDPATWLLRQSHPIEDVGDILDGLCWRLVQGGVPLTYAHAATPTLHPQLLALACRWWRAAGIIDEFEIDLAAETSEIFLASPFRAILLDGVPRRFRLETGQGRDQVLLRSLTEFGTTDLLVLPMTPISAHFPFVVLGHGRPGRLHGPASHDARGGHAAAVGDLRDAAGAADHARPSRGLSRPRGGPQGAGRCHPPRDAASGGRRSSWPWISAARPGSRIIFPARR